MTDGRTLADERIHLAALERKSARLKDTYAYTVEGYEQVTLVVGGIRIGSAPQASPLGVALTKIAHALEVGDSSPIDMILFCPKCGEQHIDAPEVIQAPAYGLHGGVIGQREAVWTNPPHRSHLCRACGHIWRPADVPTNGVYAIGTRGKNDSPRATSDPHPSPSPALPEGESVGGGLSRRTLADVVENVLFARAITDRLDGHTLDTAYEIADAILARSAASPPPPTLPDLQAMETK